MWQIWGFIGYNTTRAKNSDKSVKPLTFFCSLGIIRGFELVFAHSVKFRVQSVISEIIFDVTD